MRLRPGSDLSLAADAPFSTGSFVEATGGFRATDD